MPVVMPPASLRSDGPDWTPLDHFEDLSSGAWRRNRRPGLPSCSKLWSTFATRFKLGRDLLITSEDALRVAGKPILGGMDETLLALITCRTEGGSAARNEAVGWEERKTTIRAG